MSILIAGGGAINPEKGMSSIGGSCYIIIESNSALVIDCGVFPQENEMRKRGDKGSGLGSEKFGRKKSKRYGGRKIPVYKAPSAEAEKEFSPARLAENRKFPNMEPLKNVRNIYAVATHAHSDHIGAMAWLKRAFPQTEFFMTAETQDLSRWNLKEGIKYSKSDSGVPSYDLRDIEQMTKDTRIVKVGERISVGPFDLEFFPAGHILGAISLKVSVRRNGRPPVSVFFTGDICFRDQYTVRGAPLLDSGVLGQIDYLVTESTYAMRIQPPREMEEDRFVSDAVACLRGGGKFLAGAFTIGRVQELYAMCRRRGIIDRWPLVIAGPSAGIVSKIYLSHLARRAEDSGDRRSLSAIGDIRKFLVADPHLLRRKMRSGGPLMVIAPAGMYNGGWSMNFTAEWIHDRKNVIALTGYQAKGTPGRTLSELKNGQAIKLGGDWVRCAAEIKSYEFSAHMDGYDLLEMIGRIKAGRTFLVHGDESGMDAVCAQVGPSAAKMLANNPYTI